MVAGAGGPVVVDLDPTAKISNDFVLTGTVDAASPARAGRAGHPRLGGLHPVAVGGQVYVNIHSAVNPGGETRGQLTVAP